MGSADPFALARTLNLCLPKLCFGSVVGEVHGATAPLSTAHSNVAGFTEEVNLKVGVRSVVLPEGPFVMVVKGQGVSVSGLALLRGAGFWSEKSVPLASESSPDSSSVLQLGAIVRRRALPSVIT